jgi:serine/threonine-protein kinase HipA
MRCLCCGKQFTPTISHDELKYGWHSKCIKKFFGTTKLPDIDISYEALNALALESTNKGYTVPGVQKKLSLHLSVGKEPRLTLVNYPTGYILKPQTEDYSSLPEAEYLVMQMAEKTGIKTVPYALIKMPAQNNSLAYITRRIDRVTTKDRQTAMLAMEDFCQLDGRLTQDKYKGSYERCAKIVSQYSIRSGFDLTELFLRLVFSYVVGNSDMHLKNFSLIETNEGSGNYFLSEGYDLLPVNVILPTDTEQFALTLNGKKKNIRRKDFLVFADTVGIPTKSAENIIDGVIANKATYISLCEQSYLPDNMKQTFMQLIEERATIISER